MEAIQSVRDQSLKDFEVLVVDGGSKDQSRLIARTVSQQDPRIRLIENDDDHGPAHARAVGIRQARGRYVAFLDADDQWLPDKLETQVLFMSQPGVRFSFTRYRCISEDGRRIGCLVPMRKSYNYRCALRHRGIGALTVMIERELLTEDVISVWLRAGGEELMWWLLILRKGVTARLLDKDLARYRDTVDSLSKNQLYTLRSVWKMYRTELGLSISSATWHYLSYVLDVVTRKSWLKVCGVLTRAQPSSSGL